MPSHEKLVRKNEKLHEMIIALSNKTYYPPHKNSKSGKSWLVILGKLALLTFTNKGKISGIYIMDALSEKKKFMTRITKFCWHTTLSLSEKYCL